MSDDIVTRKEYEAREREINESKNKKKQNSNAKEPSVESEISESSSYVDETSSEENDSESDSNSQFEPENRSNVDGCAQHSPVISISPRLSPQTSINPILRPRRNARINTMNENDIQNTGFWHLDKEYSQSVSAALADHPSRKCEIIREGNVYCLKYGDNKYYKNDVIIGKKKRGGRNIFDYFKGRIVQVLFEGVKILYTHELAEGEVSRETIVPAHLTDITKE